MRRAWGLGVLAFGLLMVPGTGDPQSAPSVHHVGLVSIGTDPATWRVQWHPFIEAMRDLNDVEGRNIVIMPSFAGGKRERVSALVADLVGAKVDVIVATATPEVVAAKRMTSSIPIVMLLVPDPVGEGVVASLARPVSFLLRADEVIQ